MNHPTNDSRVPLARYLGIAAIFAVICVFALLHAGSEPNPELMVGGIPIIPIIIFVTMLGSLLKLHHWNLEVALIGFAALLVYTIYSGTGAGVHLGQHMIHEVPGLANLAFMISGFAVLAKTFENSNAGDAMPRWLPDDWRGGAMIIMMVMFLSAFLDNIAACLIGGVIAKKVYKGKIGVGFIAALIMASNLGGAPSPIGDTTTIMLVNAKVPVTEILASIPGAILATLFLARVAGKQQDRIQRIIKDENTGVVVNTRMLLAVAVALVAVIICTLTLHITAVGVWGGLLIAGIFAYRHIPWREGWAHSTMRSSLFLAALVASASLMPKFLPPATWYYTGLLGVVSAVFDNIPLTDLAIRANWGMWDLLAFAVGSGGSMMWFGSSSGVTLTKEPEFAEGRDWKKYITQGWHVPVTYVIGFVTILAWNWVIEQTPIGHYSWPIELAMFLGFGAYIWHMRQRPQGHLKTVTTDASGPPMT